MIDQQLFDQLFSIDEALKGMGMKEGMTPQDIQMAVQQRGQKQGMMAAPMQGAMAPMPRPGMIPQAGFQGNSMFPNQGGGGILQQGQQPPPMSAPSLNPMGQAMPGGISPQFPGQNQMMAQAGGQPGMGGQGGFTKTINIGADDQLESLVIKRAIQKRIQQAQGGMA